MFHLFNAQTKVLLTLTIWILAFIVKRFVTFGTKEPPIRSTAREILREEDRGEGSSPVAISNSTLPLNDVDDEWDTEEANAVNCWLLFMDRYQSLSLPKIDVNEVWPLIGKKLGEGTYATVYALEGPFSGYCLKQLKSQIVDNRSFLSEIEFMYRLKDVPGTADVIGTITYPQGIIMTRHEKTLFDWIKKDFPTPAEVVRVLMRLCNTMTLVHDKGLCHNDLKGNNIMVDFTENGILPTVIDFGLMQFSGRRVFARGNLSYSEKVRLLGKWRKKRWYAPHLYLGGGCSPSTDVFSLAVLTRTAFKILRFQPEDSLNRLIESYANGYGIDCCASVLYSELMKTHDKLVERNFRKNIKP